MKKYKNISDAKSNSDSNKKDKIKKKIEEKLKDYELTINLITKSCVEINKKFNFSKNNTDGRIDSAVLESEYLENLKLLLEQNNKKVVIPVARNWYDIEINDIPFNLKLTDGTSCDNVFNKLGILYSITGTSKHKKNLNNKDFLSIIKKTEDWKKNRNIATEYHFLVIFKSEPENILLKSIFDIKQYKTNPSNTLQINWKNEFENIEYKMKDDEIFNKIKELLKTIQKSYKQKFDDYLDYVNYDFDKIKI